MKNQFLRIFLLISSALLTVFFSCKDYIPVETTEDIPDKDSWSIYTPYDWSHDGKPYQATYCTVYSDAAGNPMKQELGDIADENFDKIMQLFNFQNLTDFIYPPGYSSIDIYLNKNHPENINWAYWGGFIITIKSDEISGPWINYTVYTARHELTHVFEFLIEGREALGTDFWFREGVAVHTGCLESNIFNTIKTLSELESWISENQNLPDKGNPIVIHQYSDLPDGADLDKYYRVFELAVRYILDDKGLGRSYQDIKNLFYEIRNGTPFTSAFSKNFGISLKFYENNFYDMIAAYLNDE